MSILARVIQAHPDWVIDAIKAEGEEILKSIEENLANRFSEETLKEALVTQFGPEVLTNTTINTKLTEVMAVARNLGKGKGR